MAEWQRIFNVLFSNRTSLADWEGNDHLAEAGQDVAVVVAVEAEGKEQTAVGAAAAVAAVAVVVSAVAVGQVEQVVGAVLVEPGQEQGRPVEPSSGSRGKRTERGIRYRPKWRHGRRQLKAVGS